MWKRAQMRHRIIALENNTSSSPPSLLNLSCFHLSSEIGWGRKERIRERLVNFTNQLMEAFIYIHSSECRSFEKRNAPFLSEVERFFVADLSLIMEVALVTDENHGSVITIFLIKWDKEETDWNEAKEKKWLLPQEEFVGRSYRVPQKNHVML